MLVEGEESLEGTVEERRGSVSVATPRPVVVTGAVAHAADLPLPLTQRRQASKILKELLPKLTGNSGSKWYKTLSAVDLKGHQLDSSWRKDL